MGKKSLWVFLIMLVTLGLNMKMIGITKAQTHDVAVTNVSPSETLVKWSELVNITVVVENQGTESESFNVALYRDTTIIEVKALTELAAGQNRTAVFTWNTTETIGEIYALTSKQKTYSITANVSTVLGEIDTEDNSLTSPNKIRVISQYIAVRPQNTVDITLTEGKNYTISIHTDYNGSDIWGWQVSLNFNPNILECTEISNGDLITTTKHPDAKFLQAFNNTIGELSIGAFFYYVFPDEPPTTSGPGTFANVTFKVVGTGYSNITLGENTYLQVYNPSVNPDEPYDIIDEYHPSLNHIRSGYFSNTIAQMTDIAVVSVEPLSTSVTIGQSMNISVVVENKGESVQSFDVRLYYGYSPDFPSQNVIGTQTVQSLEAGKMKTLVFAWNTTNVKEGNYVITATTIGVQGDADTTNNRRDSNGMVEVKLKELRPLPITEIAIGVVVVVSIIAAVYLILKKRRKEPTID